MTKKFECFSLQKLHIAQTFICILTVFLYFLLLSGGSSRDVVERSNKLIINASKSYDPDDKTFDSSNLVFRWQCKANCSNISWQNICSIVTVNVSLLKVGDRFEFSVDVSLREKRANVTQKIRIVANGSLVTKIM